MNVPVFGPATGVEKRLTYAELQAAIQSGNPIDALNNAPSTGRTRSYSGTITFTLDSIGPLKTYPATATTPVESAAQIAGRVTVTGSPDDSWHGERTFLSSGDDVAGESVYWTTAAAGENLRITSGAENEVLGVKWNGTTWVLDRLIVSNWQVGADDSGTYATFWVDTVSKVPFTRG